MTDKIVDIRASYQGILLKTLSIKVNTKHRCSLLVDICHKNLNISYCFVLYGQNYSVNHVLEKNSISDIHLKIENEYTALVIAESLEKNTPTFVLPFSELQPIQHFIQVIDLALNAIFYTFAKWDLCEYIGQSIEGLSVSIHQD